MPYYLRVNKYLCRMFGNKLFLKAGGIQNLTDARYFSSKAVDMVGFCFDTASPQYINPREAQQIMGWLEGPKRCGEFGRMDVKSIREAAMILGLDYVQFIPEASVEEYSSIETPIILELPGLPVADLLAYAESWNGRFAYLLLDYSNTEQLPSLNELKPLLAKYPVLLDWPDAYQDVLNAGATGMNLRGAPEQKTGEKSFAELDLFFALVQDEL